MKKTKLLIAILIVIAILMGNITILLNNISIAVQNDVTVVIDSDEEHRLELSDNGLVLTYTCSDNSTYSYRVMNGNTPLTITKRTEEPNPGQYNDVFVIEGIESNQNVRIVGTNIYLNQIRNILWWREHWNVSTRE